jgi:indolepyruvate decarboxylase
MNLVESLLHALKREGAPLVFGIPGDFALPYFRVLESSQILPLYTLSHEPGVGFAADAAARLTSAPAVAAVTYGAGALNMVNAVAAAFAEKVPLVVLSGAPGQAEVDSGLLLHHQAKRIDSQFEIFKEVTCDQARLDDVATAPALIARVLASCKRRSEPVYLEIPRDMVNLECAEVPPIAATPVDGNALEACVEEILARLTRARSPVLMVGVEVRRYCIEQEVAELARRLKVPVVSGFMGRGLLADEPALHAGTYLGVAGTPDVTQLVEASDGLFLLGEIICDTNFAVSKTRIDMRQTIQALDGRVTLGYHTYPDIPLADLVRRLVERAQPIGHAAALAPTSYPRGLSADESPIAPTDICAAVNDLFAEHGKMPIASDVGDCLFTALDIEPTAFVAPGYYATMGYGVPAGLGIQAATGERPLILVGDGAFQMTGWELGNCRRYGWDPIVLVFNNASWEMLRAFQPESAFNTLERWDFASMAAGMGGDGVRVETRAALKHALDEAVRRRGRFQLIDIALPKGVLSTTLARFVAGVKRMSG